jgi:hypothetical protein
MIVGITGHQKRKGLDWSWVNETLRAELTALGGITRALSSLAAGGGPEIRSGRAGDEHPRSRRAADDRL